MNPLDDATWDALRERQLEWQRQNPEPRHTPAEVCDCPMPWREDRGKGHCAARGDIVRGAERRTKPMTLQEFMAHPDVLGS